MNAMLFQFWQITGIGIRAQAADEAVSLDLEVSEAIRTIDNMMAGFMAILPKLGIAVLVLGVFLLIAWGTKKLIERGPEKLGMSANLRKAIGRLSQWVVMFLGFMIAVAIVAPSVTPAKLLSALGFGGIAIGFAFKDILQNFLAGILLLVREPFSTGDQVQLGEFVGTVEEINTRSTIIKTYDGTRVILPNGQVYTSPMTVLTAYEARRSQYDIGIGYGDDIGEASKVILNVLQSTDSVKSDPAPDVVLADLAGSTVNLRARWWTDPRRTDVVQVKHAVIKAIKLGLDDASIDMPYPTQVLLLHDQTEDSDGDRTRQREGWPAEKTVPDYRENADYQNM